MATPKTSPREIARAIASGSDTIEMLASAVSVTTDRVEVMVKSMVDRGLVYHDGDVLALTAAGEHARKSAP